MQPEKIGVYVHIPFCLAKCSYCAFVSQAGAGNLHSRYVAALCREITAAGGDFSVRDADTVFFGGGTPTSLVTTQLISVLQALRNSIRLTADAEISVEANPGTVDPKSLTQMRKAGFNRISIGVQSFDDRVLTAVGRIHRSNDAKKSIREARRAGFENVSIDLMYGLPEQTLTSWIETLEMAVSLRPDHISAYGLKLEKGTPLEAAVSAGHSALPPEEEEEAMYDALNTFLPQQGFSRYEISNYAHEGSECRHNLKYWKFRPYRGFGVAAHSFNGIDRFSNTENINCYAERIEAGESPEDFRETPDKATRIGEYVFLALRLTEGLSLEEFRHKFGQDFYELFNEQALRLAKMELLTVNNNTLRLTSRGMKFGNQVFADFLP